MSENNKNPNRLISESSPYLLQHAYNPVDWYPWGEEAFQKAAAENKPVLVSIGYSSCHWCHVMEKESFEDEEIAAIMNQNFVCIKVDREERPDIDQLYMNAVNIIYGHGGWPLNCFVLPDQRPFWGATYFPKERWADILHQISNIYKTEKETVENQAESVSRRINSQELIISDADSGLSEKQSLHEIIDTLKFDFDNLNGGNYGSPKFPMPALYSFLLHANYFLHDSAIAAHLKLTLQRMAFGGIYDHLGGGFARYSTDETWKVPHFEKMLYDNAQLISLYAAAYKQFHDPLFLSVIKETASFIRREMTSPNGGFYSALDADSEGVEGKYYVWKKEEIDLVLGENAALFSEFYQVGKAGKWEDENNILLKTLSEKEFAAKNNLDYQAFTDKMMNCRKLLLHSRSKRIRPFLDEKILVCWNALMIKAYTDLWQAASQNTYLEEAIKNAEFIEKNMIMTDGGVFRVFNKGVAKIPGFLDDYAFMTEALLGLYQATFDRHYLFWAKNLTDYAILHFYDSTVGLFFYNSGLSETLISRSKETSDNVIPSSNAVMAQNLFRLWRLFEDKDYLAISGRINDIMRNNAIKNPRFNYKFAELLTMNAYDFNLVVINGKGNATFRNDLIKNYLPNAMYAGTADDDAYLTVFENRISATNETRIFICTSKECLPPVTSVEEAIKHLR
jgi:uncharacterized protein